MLNNIYKTKNGDFIYIACMEDSHLLNVIRLHLDWIHQLNKSLLSKTRPEKTIYSTSTKGDIIEEIKKILDFLQPYVFEASVRGLDVTTMLQQGLGRTGQEIPIGLLNNNDNNNNNDNLW